MASEPDEWILMQRQTIAELSDAPGRADLLDVFNGLGTATWALIEVLYRAGQVDGATVSIEQWRVEWRGMLAEQQLLLLAMTVPGWPRLKPRDYRGGIIDD